LSRACLGKMIVLHTNDGRGEGQGGCFRLFLFLACRPHRGGHQRRTPEEKRDLFWSFHYVCPEPVLAKCSFLYINGPKRPFLLTAVVFLGSFGPQVILTAKNAIFAQFMYQNDRFAKTGSGQTWEKHTKSGLFRTIEAERHLRTRHCFQCFSL
jgi:hypothetical protein